MGIVEGIWRKVPQRTLLKVFEFTNDVQLQKTSRLLYDSGYAYVPKIDALPINDSGQNQGGIPYIDLDYGYRFFGFRNERKEDEYYNLLNQATRDVLVKEAYYTAEDFIRGYIETSQVRHQRYYQVDEGDTVIQVGAYIGHYTTILSRAVGSSGRVIAIEAHPTNADLLRKNVEQNCLDNVSIVEKAVSNEAGELTFFETTRPGGKDNTLVVDNYENYSDSELNEMTTPVTTLSEIIDSYGIGSVDYLPLTINGAELKALKGLNNSIDKVSHCMAVGGISYEDTTSEDRIASFLNQNNFDVKVREESVAPVVYGDK